MLVTGHIYKAMDKKEITAMVLIDLSKAFDSTCQLRVILQTECSRHDLVHLAPLS